MQSTAEESSGILPVTQRNLKDWMLAQGEREVTDYYMEMLALWQELDLSSKEEWHCAEDSALFKKRQEKESF